MIQIIKSKDKTKLLIDGYTQGSYVVGNYCKDYSYSEFDNTDLIRLGLKSAKPLEDEIIRLQELCENLSKQLYLKNKRSDDLNKE